MKREPTFGPNIQQAVPFFWVLDMDISIRYYTEGLGFRMTKQWLHEGQVRWCWLERGGAALMIQQFWKEGHHANLPTGTLGEGISIYFICEDAVAFYREIKSRGIEASIPNVGNGLWVTSLTDPNGYRLSFESYTDEPEETEFSEQAA
jgi:lactoylglutathione lyase